MGPPAPRNAKPANPVSLMLFGILGTITLIGGYKLLVRPYHEETRRKNAQEFANFLYESKNKQLMEENHQTE